MRLPRYGIEGDFAPLPRFETHRCAGGNIQALAPRGCPIEQQGRVGFREMVVAADLDRPVAGIRDDQRGAVEAGVQLDLAGQRQDFAGYHCITLLCRPRHGRA